MPRYRFEPGRSRFTVQAFAGGALAVLGHSPTFTVRDFAGIMSVDGPGVEGLSVELTVKAKSLTVLDRIKPADREEIENRMGREVLETRTFPEITFRTVDIGADPPNQGQYRVFLGGLLTLHGVTQPLGFLADFQIDEREARLLGHCPLLMSSYRIRPVTALAGAIKLKDELRLNFDLMASRENS